MVCLSSFNIDMQVTAVSRTWMLRIILDVPRRLRGLKKVEVIPSLRGNENMMMLS